MASFTQWGLNWSGLACLSQDQVASLPQEANLGLLTKQQGAKSVEIESAKPLEVQALQSHTVSQSES